MFIQRYLFLLITIFSFDTINSFAQNLMPVASLSIGHIKTFTEKQVNSGAFEIDQSNLRFGLSLTNNFNLKRKYFIKTGIRYTNYKTNVSALNSFNYVLAKPYPFIWTQKFESFNIPINFGKYIWLFNKVPGEVFIGISPGIFNMGTSILNLQAIVLKDVNSVDTFTKVILFWI